MSEAFDDLKRLSEMLANGEITQAEYDKIKADLLAESETPAAPSHPMEGKPAGWYDDPSGKTTAHQAYWDGTGWTGQTRRRPSAEATGVAQSKQVVEPKKKRSRVRTAVWVLAGVLALIVIGSQLGEGGGSNTPDPESVLADPQVSDVSDASLLVIADTGNANPTATQIARYAAALNVLTDTCIEPPGVSHSDMAIGGKKILSDAGVQVTALVILESMGELADTMRAERLDCADTYATFFVLLEESQ